MKVSFLIKNGFTCGLSKKNIGRLFSSVNLALLPSSSSEDETLLLEESIGVSTSLCCVSAVGDSQIYADRNCVNLAVSPSSFSDDETLVVEESDRVSTSLFCVSAERNRNSRASRNCVNYEFRYPRSSAFKYEVSADDEMEVMKMILKDYGWNFGFRSCQKIDLDEKNVIRLLNSLYYEGGSAALSLRFFRWLEFGLGWKHTIRTVCTLIGIMVLGNMNYRAIDLLACLVRGYPQCAQPDELVKVLHELCVRRILESVYGMLVRCYTLESMIDEAVETICSMNKFGIFPSARVYDSLIKSLLELDQAKLAWDLLEDMQNRCLVSVATITLFIQYYCRKGNLESGWKLLVHMKYYGNKPDVVAYTAFIHILCKSSYLKEATCLIFKMMEMGISPDTVLLTSIIDGYCKVARVSDAMCIVKLFHVQPTVFLYNIFISKLSKEGSMEQASSVFQEMLLSGIRPDCFSYTTMIDGYCKITDARKALQYFGRMLKDGIEPSVITYTVLISSYCKSADVETAQCLLHKMSRLELIPDIFVYNTLIAGYKNTGQLQKAFELLNIIKSAGTLPDVVTYNTLIHGLIMGGFVSEANDLLDELIMRGFSPDVVTFTNIIGGYSNKGLFEDAFLVWSYMGRYNMKPDVITCSALLNGFCRTGRMVEARALFHKMLGAGLVPDLILYNTLIHGFCRTGDIEEACHLINMMAESNIHPNDVTYRALVLGYEKKFATHPMESAASKLQVILQRHGMDIGIEPSNFL